ncbi:hypothetical protein SALBM311S_00798 [Streptomyces alboniger]
MGHEGAQPTVCEEGTATCLTCSRGQEADQDKLRLSKGASSGSDSLVETQASGVQVGDSALTTMPTFAERPSALSQY